MENHRIETGLLGVLTLIAVGVVFKAAQSVILPLIIAWLLSYLLAPVVNWMVRYKIPVGPAVLLVLVLVLGVCYLAGIFIHARVAAFAGQYEKYQMQLMEIITDVNTRFNLPADVVNNLDFNWMQWIGKKAVGFSSSFVSFMSNLVLVLIFLVFMLLGKPYSRYKVLRAFPKERGEQILNVINKIAHDIGTYLSVKLTISLITGVLVWGGCLLLGIDFPVTWGTLAFFLNFIPTLGSVLASIPPILLALVQYYPSYGRAVATAVIMLSIQQTMGSFIEPKVQGDNLNLSPVVILISLVFWGWLWGITGALLSVPIAVAIKITCENIKPLYPISIMMGSGRAYAKK
jgi:predicted PurR-regulated permease PerM